MKFRWSLAPTQPLLAAPLAEESNISPLLAQCLINRGFSESKSVTQFLQPRLKQLADPFLLPNMDLAVERLSRARAENEPLVIFGDYDVDGITSTALLVEFLSAFGWTVNYYLPHRFEEGYGLSQEGVENCLKKFPAKLLLAVDCGSTAVAAIDWLCQQGIETIVLDHHQVSNPAPNAVALVNPQLSLESKVLGLESAKNPHFPTQDSGLKTQDFSELCSAGLAFKLAHAILKRLRELNFSPAHEYDLRPLLDLVALGTIADIVPLIGENRIFVTAGLKYLNGTKRPGLLALKSVAQINQTIGSYEVGFQLAPRLNAAGRMENAEEALQLLLAKNFSEAEPLARNLDERNRQRQQIERGMTEQVIGAVKARFNSETDFVIVEGQLLWHIGVVGIVASRVLQEFYRPTIIFGGEGNEWRGSGRSVDGFDLAAALRECNDLLIKHGGHAMAAGLTIHPDNIDQFRIRLNEHARRTLKIEQLQPTLRLDAEISLADLTLECLEELETLKPTGQKNPPINLVLRNVSHQRSPQRMGQENQHAKFWVTDGKKMLEAVWWNCGGAALPKVSFDLAFTPQINLFNENRSVQLKVLDWRPV
ncbi:MAG: DHHA1 domain-containing protein [Verrucomicrobiota bacterium]|nr:DHHA1 domain-containing protein [Verrucomicrobiota bacterium]